MSTHPPRKPAEDMKTTPNSSIVDKIYQGEAPDTTDTDLRYAAYANRARTILRAGQRYIAYTSDIGESFRPVAHPYLIRTAYGISWLYLTGDVVNEGYKAYISNQAKLRGGAVSSVPEFLRETKGKVKEVTEAVGRKGLDGVKEEDFQLHPKGGVGFMEDYRTVMVQRALFQGIASMGLPAFTIHSVVKYSGRAMKDVKNVKVRTWAPIGLGLAVVPALPFIFDKPVEEAVEWVFHRGHQVISGSHHEAKRGESKKEL